jgi:hypothetical protein
MGLLNLFSKPAAAQNLVRLPSGTFTVLPDGRISTSTLPQSFPATQVREIGKLVLGAFVTARQANLPLGELVIEFGSLKITAKDMRGGAMIFLAPRDLTQK